MALAFHYLVCPLCAKKASQTSLYASAHACTCAYLRTCACVLMCAHTCVAYGVCVCACKHMYTNTGVSLCNHSCVAPNPACCFPYSPVLLCAAVPAALLCTAVPAALWCCCCPCSPAVCCCCPSTLRAPTAVPAALLEGSEGFDSSRGTWRRSGWKELDELRRVRQLEASAWHAPACMCTPHLGTKLTVHWDPAPAV